MSSADTIKRVAEIIKSDSERRFIVVSAPGKRFDNDIKITDSLFDCYSRWDKNGPEIFDSVANRFLELASDLGVLSGVAEILASYKERLPRLKTPDGLVAMGEHLSAYILSSYIGWDFVDSKDIIKFDINGEFNSEYTNDLCSKILKNYTHAVISGFYGSDPLNNIRVFTRGGSDITGAIVARAVSADVYENWTDVLGFYVADPRIVKNPKIIKSLSYKEMRELSYMGASVIHPDSVFPVRQANIAINIRNTFYPEHQGTMIYPNLTEFDSLVTGIAGKKYFTSILIEKSKMNSEVGFTRKLLSVLENYHVSFEHIPSGIDTMTLVIANSEIKGRLQEIISDIKTAVSPETIEVQENLSLIATVGHGMSFKTGTASRLFSALSRYGINVRMIDQGSSELNIIVAVANDDYEKAINAIYEEFIN